MRTLYPRCQLALPTRTAPAEALEEAQPVRRVLLAGRRTRLYPATVGLELSARLIDFGGPPSWSRDELICDMTSIGFPVVLDDSQQQPDNACGVVAAAVAKRMQAPDWRHAALDFAVHPCLNTAARRILCLEHDDWLSNADVWRLYDMFMSNKPTFAESFCVCPRDRLLLQMQSDVLNATPVMRVCVCNTATSRESGDHWFTVAYSIEKIR